MNRQRYPEELKFDWPTSEVEQVAKLLCQPDPGRLLDYIARRAGQVGYDQSAIEAIAA